ncbi:MAG: helix-turn-helix domain-containing protein [Panacagrimonas sp.]
MNLLRKRLGKNQAQMAGLLDVSLRGYQNYERGDREIPVVALERAQDSAGVNPHWVLDGAGEMLLPRPYRNSSPGQDCSPRTSTLDDAEQLLLDVWRALELPMRHAVLRMVAALSHAAWVPPFVEAPGAAAAPITPETPAARLRLARHRLGLSQKALGQQLGVTLAAYSNYEQGHRRIPYHLIEQAEPTLRLSAEWVFSGRGDMLVRREGAERT